MKTYVLGLAALAVLVLGWGVVAPQLISAKSDLLVALGMGVVVLVPALVYRIFNFWSNSAEGNSIIEKLKD